MSDSTNFDRACYEKNEHYIFVSLLQKYKIILGTERSPFINRKKCAAANALAAEYNKHCEHKLTIRKVLKKVCNMKARLKSKNYKNLYRTKKLQYTDWERMFLDLWVGSGNPLLANTKSKKSLEEKSKPGNSIHSEDIEVKIEPEEYVVQDSPENPEKTPINLWEAESERCESSKCESEKSESEKYDSKKYDSESYETMSLDELKHIALIAQIKTLRAQEEAARTKSELNEYKLSLLKRSGRYE